MITRLSRRQQSSTSDIIIPETRDYLHGSNAGCVFFFGLEIIPGGILAFIGMVRAAKARMIGFLVLGIIEVIGAVLSLLIVLFIIFIAGPGV